MTPPDVRDRSRARSSDRYNLEGAVENPAGRGKPPRSPNAFTAMVAVPDPFDKKVRQVATANRCVDILEYERSRDMISARAYAVGRIVQAVFERARGAGSGSQWRQGDRVDAVVAQECAIIYAIEDARTVMVYVQRIRDAVGRIDANILQQVLGEGKTYADVAALRGRPSARGISYFASRFRDALEELAKAWEKKGRR